MAHSRGITVLDLASVGPAARCTRVLADYGATVVKVGAVPGRGAQPIGPPSTPTVARAISSGPRSISRHPRGKQPSSPWCKTADVVVESFRPGVVDRLGIGFDDLRAANPRIILCSTTGYGQSGPRAAWAGHDINYLAQGGYLATDRAGRRRGAAGLWSNHRRRGGRGHAGGDGDHGRADRPRKRRRREGISMCRSPTACSGSPRWLSTSTWPPAQRSDIGHNIITGRYACYDTYQAADGRWLAVGAIEAKFFANLCRLLGCQQWVEHQLDDEVQDKIRADFQAAFATKDRDAWVAELAGADTCVSPVLSVSELVDDEQYRARIAFVEAVVESADPAGTGGSGPVPSGRPGARRHGASYTNRLWPATRLGRIPTRLLTEARDRTYADQHLREQGIVA